MRVIEAIFSDRMGFLALVLLIGRRGDISAFLAFFLLLNCGMRPKRGSLRGPPVHLLCVNNVVLALLYQPSEFDLTFTRSRY